MSLSDIAEEEEWNKDKSQHRSNKHGILVLPKLYTETCHHEVIQKFGGWEDDYTMNEAISITQMQVNVSW